MSSRIVVAFPGCAVGCCQALTRQALLAGATFIVADEAHVMKNAETAKCRLMRQLSSRRRLALTGYPLQNNLEEYYQMIMWVSQPS